MAATRFVTSAITVMLLALSMGPAGAHGTGGLPATVSAPFDSTFTQESCWTLNCTTSTAHADATTGAFAVNSEANRENPAYARAGFRDLFVTTSAAEAIRVSVRYEMEAHASPPGTLDVQRSALAAVSFWIRHSKCDSCDVAVDYSLVDDDALTATPSDVSGEVVVTTEIRNGDGGMVPAGELSFHADVWSNAWLSMGHTSRFARASGYLRSITLERIGNAPPTPALSYSCSNATCQFDATASRDDDGSVAGYSWDFGDGSAAATGDRVTHTFPSRSASYLVKLVVSDNQGASAETSKTVSCRLSGKTTRCS